MDVKSDEGRKRNTKRRRSLIKTMSKINQMEEEKEKKQEDVAAVWSQELRV